MKAKVLLLALALFGFGATAIASETTSTSATEQSSSSSLKVSAVRDYGNINPDGNTDRFYLQLNRPCQSNVAVEVKVMVEGKCIGQKPVFISRGNSTSGSEYIKVGTKYKGKHYKLVTKVKMGTYDDGM